MRYALNIYDFSLGTYFKQAYGARPVKRLLARAIDIFCT
jgi:hypothetical protein